MLHRKRTRRMIAATLLLVMLTNTLAPTVTYALTSGPTQPEATSFEPVDTTDMVNLQTGDFTYNMPLVNVPGPEGGYPVSLAYHAGIQPNEDASWVGLGWILNPGAISRSVNGFPDDWHLPSASSQAYWSGGTTTTYSVGINIGIANTPLSANFGLSFSQDTYRGFGVGFSMGLGGGIGVGPVKFNMGIEIGMNPYGGGYLSGNLGFSGGKNLKSWNTSMGLYMDESSNVTVSGNVGFFESNLQISMATNGKPSVAVGSYSKFVTSSQEAGIQTSSSGFSIGIGPISFSYRKDRYWIDQRTSITAHGAIHSSGWATGAGGKVFDDVAYDTYALLENHLDKDIASYPDPTIVQGGAFLDFDIYSVTAQGLGGNMRPYQFQGEVLGQNRKDNSGNYLVSYYSPGVTDPKPEFRFIEDFSNSFRQNYPDYADPNLNLRSVIPPFDANPVYGNNDGNYGYGSPRLAGSKHVTVGATIQPSNATGYNQNDRYKSFMITGFSITNANGVTYHYALPAYCWGEEKYQEKINHTNGLFFNRSKKPEAYAYTWYLTTITGPDFVDRNSDGKANENDWGYWVNFEYGKWSNRYVWRNPAEGYHKDEDFQFQNTSMGYREVYYLNTIRTRTHVALFEKEVRFDAKGSSTAIFNTNFSNSIPTDYTNDGVFDQQSSLSLKLDRIYVLNAEDANMVSTTSGNASAYVPFRNPVCNDCELAGNILDRLDIEAVGRTAIENKSIRIVDFGYDYSLCPFTPNSFESQSPSAKEGKLTLKYVRQLGKSASSQLPPVRFEYDLTGSDTKTATVTLSSINFTTTDGGFEIGDMIMEQINPEVFAGVIKGKSFSGGIYTYTLIQSYHTGGTTTANIRTTKNPRYMEYAIDIWGMFKVDQRFLGFTDENLARRPSPLSGLSIDAWSLRKITTSLGSELRIKYEADTYRRSVVSTGKSFHMQAVGSNNPSTDLEYDFIGFDQLGGSKVSDFFQPGDVVDFVAIQGSQWVDDEPVIHDDPVQRVLDSRTFSQPVTVQSINDAGERIVLHCDGFPAIIHTNTQGYYTEGGGLLTNAPIVSRNPQQLNLSPNKERSVIGGGLRVKSIDITNAPDDRVYTTTFGYNVSDNSNISSGVVSYEPVGLDKAPYDAPFNFWAFTKTKINFSKALHKDLSTLYSISREIPATGVIYGRVTVTNTVKNAEEQNARDIEGKSEYTFEVFRENMAGKETIGTPQQGSNGLGTYYTKNLAVKKLGGAIGTIKRVVQYDKNGKKLSEVRYDYLHDGLENLSFSDFMAAYKTRLSQFFYQGYLQERLSEVKEVTNQANSADNGVKATLSAREEYPTINIGYTQIDHMRGVMTTSKTIGFDFYSGAVTKTIETDIYGNKFMSEVIPAYRKYSSMGLKLSNGNNKNMLTQTTGEYLYKVDASNPNTVLGLASASVTTWSNLVGVIDPNGNSIVQNILDNNTGSAWREQTSYAWQPDNKTTDGLTAIGNFVDFNWTTPGSADSRWKKITENTLFDVYSNGLEMKDVNGNASAVRMNYKNEKVELGGDPANFYELAYGSAEDEGVNQTSNVFVKKVNGIISTGASVAHTGAGSLRLPGSGNKAFVYTVNTNNLVAGRDYIASVWVKPVTGSASDVKLYYDINGVVKANSVSSGSSTKIAGGWILLDLKINGTDIVPGVTLNVGCRNDHSTAEAYVDDMRFNPLSANTTAYVYDNFTGELNFVLDRNNFYSKYEYDGNGRLIKIFREKLGGGTIKTNEYQYNFSAPKYLSFAVSQYYTKNDCSGGNIGTPYLVTLPEGAVVSYLSAADAQTKREILAQKIANENGGCAPAAYMAVSVPTTANRIFSVNFIQNGVNVRSKSFFQTGGTVDNIPAGTYTVTVTQTNNTPRLVSLSGFGSQTAVSVSFNNVTLNGGVFTGILTIN
jgi:hypothetical protein